MKPLIIFGTGDIAEIARFYFEQDASVGVAAFTVDGDYLKEPTFGGLSVVPFDRVVVEFPPAEFDMFIAISYSRVNRTRAEKYAAAKALGYTLATYVSSRATVWPGFAVGDNCFILEDNTIQPFARIGNDATLWSGNHIGHHSRIGDHCFISSHVVVSGGVEIGEYSFVGVNATIRDHVRVGASAVIGAGALIVEDVPDLGVCIQGAAELSRVPSNRLRKI